MTLVERVAPACRGAEFADFFEASDRAVLATAPALSGADQTIVYVNQAFERMTGWPREEILGRTPAVLQGPETDRGIFVDMRRALAEGRAWRGETVNYRRDGRPFAMAWSISPVRGEGGVRAFLAAGLLKQTMNVPYVAGMDMVSFMQRPSTDEACRAFLARVRWPNGTVCPKCGSVGRASRLRSRPGTWGCCVGACKAQLSVTAGTPLHRTRVPLAKWFLAIWLISTSSKGVSGAKNPKTTIRAPAPVARSGGAATVARWFWSPRSAVVMSGSGGSRRIHRARSATPCGH